MFNSQQQNRPNLFDPRDIKTVSMGAHGLRGTVWGNVDYVEEIFPALFTAWNIKYEIPGFFLWINIEAQLKTYFRYFTAVVPQWAQNEGNNPTLHGGLNSIGYYVNGQNMFIPAQYQLGGSDASSPYYWGNYKQDIFSEQLKIDFRASYDNITTPSFAAFATVFSLSIAYVPMSRYQVKRLI